MIALVFIFGLPLRKLRVELLQKSKSQHFITEPGMFFSRQ